MSQTITNEVKSIPFVVEVFFDGGCPLCVREIGMLKRWDSQNRIRFTDIDDPDFQAEVYGKTYDDLMSRIQGRLYDGTWIEGVEVFRQLYSAVGFGPLVWVTRLPVISQLMTLGYRIFARNRLRLTGRCQGKACAIPRDSESAPVVSAGGTPGGQ